jgi:hypothetical protein
MFAAVDRAVIVALARERCMMQQRMQSQARGSKSAGRVTALETCQRHHVIRAALTATFR